jgi:hypothetical protein
MGSSFLIRTRAFRLLGGTLIVAGSVMLAYLVALVLWQFSSLKSEVLGTTLRAVDQALLGLSPALAWASSLQLAMGLAGLGVALGSLGVLMISRQAARLSEEKRSIEDRLRRVHVYRDDARREPFIGPDAQVHGRDAKERRVA